MPRLGARRLRDEVDQRVRLHDDPDARTDGFVLLIGFLALAAAGGEDDVATLPADA